ncbi:hypothetical protein T06_5378 [Trichinella sp. T6]|nr:hypothetical protein T06_5378 [Trichinella sp. T6]
MTNKTTAEKRVRESVCQQQPRDVRTVTVRVEYAGSGTNEIFVFFWWSSCSWWIPL